MIASRLAVAEGTGRRTLLLVLVLSLPPLALQLAAPVAQLGAGSVEYGRLRSLYFDRQLERADARPSAALGPALLWLPFYAVGDAAARLTGDVAAGYAAAHVRSVALGSLFYAVLGLWLLSGVLSEMASAAAVFWTTVLTLYATSLFWSTAYEPVPGHACSFFLAAAVLRAWWGSRHSLSPRRALALGVLIGVSATLRFEDAALLLLPGATLAGEWRRGPRPALATLATTLTGFGIGALPQLLAWKALLGAYLPPHASELLSLRHAWLLESVFSSRHGLLYWTPVLWGGVLGVLGLLRRSAFTGLAILAPLALLSLLDAGWGDAGTDSSFANQRFESALPFLALGLALSLDAALRFAARRPGTALAALLAPFFVWNALLMQQYRSDRLPRDLTVSFAAVTENNADLLADAVGTPLAWPANWIFALRHRMPPARYDLMAGKELFPQRGRVGVIAMGDDRVDPALLGEGFSSRTACGAAVCRAVLGRARLFAPLAAPEPLEASVRASGSGTLEVSVNGRPLARLPLRAELADLPLRIPAGVLRRELNEIALQASERALLDRIVFTRSAAFRGTP